MIMIVKRYFYGVSTVVNIFFIAIRSKNYINKIFLD